jgi:hypothetical protein
MRAMRLVSAKRFQRYQKGQVVLESLERECSSEWAARSMSKLHPQLAPMNVAHETRVEGPNAGEGHQLRLTL